ncbi:MAG TPA: hypothetical protein VG457_02705 [Planctomycetota bacterium]|nr:hypothetical protein [Planctomycetota bacterium]
MEHRKLVLVRSAAVPAVLLLALAWASPLHAAGLPKGQTQDHGPYGLPSLKRLTEVCSLTHDQEQGELQVYNEYKHREHEEMQQKSAAGGSGLQDCIAAVKKLLTPDQQKKLDELLSESKGKKKKT